MICLFRYKISCSTNYIFEEKFTICKFEFYSQNYVNYSKVKVDLESDTLDKAIEECNIELRKVLDLMAFTYNIKFNYELTEVHEIIVEDLMKPNGYFKTFINVVQPLPNQIENINSLLEKITGNTSIVVNNSYNYYICGLNVLEFKLEAFLNFFKAIEVIVKTYRKKMTQDQIDSAEVELEKLKENLKNRLNNPVSTSNKKTIEKCKEISDLCQNIAEQCDPSLKPTSEYALEVLNLDKYKSNVSNLINIRNRVVAHGIGDRDYTELKIEDEELKECMKIAKDIILAYIEISK